MKYYTNWQVPLWDFFIKKRKYLDIPLNTMVESDAVETEGMLLVSFTNSKGKQSGWVETKYLEPFVHALPFDCVDLSDIQTPDQSDAKQYVIWEGDKETNMCGEICIAHILGMPLSGILANWKAKHLTFYQRFFKGSKAPGTGPKDLIDLFKLADVEAFDLSKKFTKYSPHYFSEFVKENHVIASCYMDGRSGRLRGSGVLHWVVVADVVPDRMGFGWVDIYNPFNNCVERYSWQEWLATSRNSPYGVYVKRHNEV